MLLNKFGRAGNDLLSRALRRSTIGATAFHCPVRDGMECFARAKITSSSKLTKKRLQKYFKLNKQTLRFVLSSNDRLNTARF